MTIGESVSHTIFLCNRFKEMQFGILHGQHKGVQISNKLIPADLLSLQNVKC